VAAHFRRRFSIEVIILQQGPAVPARRQDSTMLFNVILGLHVVNCIVLIIVVLLQSSKGGGLAGAFGGGGGQTMFGGAETATFLSKITTYLAVAFMVLSLILAFMSAKRNTAPRSVIREAAQQQGNVIPTGQSIDQLLGAADTTATGSEGIIPIDSTGSGE
jgi:preprotein translocase subunit SecG